MGIWYFIILLGAHGLGASYLYPAIKNMLKDWEKGEYDRFKSWIWVLRLMLVGLFALGVYMSWNMVK